MRGFRDRLLRFERGLEQLDPRDRRLVRVLVGRLAVQWIGEYGPSHRTLVAEVAIGASIRRVDVFSDPPVGDDEFWDQVAGRIEDLDVSWAHDRRRPRGVWFELPPRDQMW